MKDLLIQEVLNLSKWVNTSKTRCELKIKKQKYCGVHAGYEESCQKKYQKKNTTQNWEEKAKFELKSP